MPRLKNQDEFNRIQKHLNVISEASQMDKLAFCIGIDHSKLIGCFVGTKVEDVPALRAAHIGIGIKGAMMDRLTEAAVEIVIPSDSLTHFKKLIEWGNLSVNFFRKYLTFYLTPCIVSFIVSLITSLVSNQMAINVLHCTWASLVICPLVGISFSFSSCSHESKGTVPEKMKRS